MSCEQFSIHVRERVAFVGWCWTCRLLSLNPRRTGATRQCRCLMDAGRRMRPSESQATVNARVIGRPLLTQGRAQLRAQPGFAEFSGLGTADVEPLPKSQAAVKCIPFAFHQVRREATSAFSIWHLSTLPLLLFSFRLRICCVQNAGMERTIRPCFSPVRGHRASGPAFSVSGNRARGPVSSGTASPG